MVNIILYNVLALLVIGYVHGEVPQWPIFGYDAGNTGQAPYSLSINGVPAAASKWDTMFYTGTGTASSPVITSDGDIISSTYGSTVTRYRFGSQDAVWASSRYLDIYGSFSSPTLTNQGDVIVAAFNGAVLSFSASTGDQNWIYPGALDEYAGKLSNRLSSPAITSGGDVIVGNWNGSVFSLSSSGSLRWHFSTGGMVLGTPSISPAGHIYIGSTDSNIYSLTNDGSKRWNYKTGGMISSTIVVSPSGNELYVGSQDGNLYCLSSQGSILWIQKVGAGSALKSSPALSSSGNIIIGSTDGYLYSFSAGGSLQWNSPLGNRFVTLSPINSSPVISADGGIVIGSDDHSLYCFSSSKGSLLWSFGTKNRVSERAVITLSGSVVFSSEDQYIYYLTSSPTPLPTSLPSKLPTAAPFSAPPFTLPPLSAAERPNLFSHNEGIVLGSSAFLSLVLAFVILLMRDTISAFSLGQHSLLRSFWRVIRQTKESESASEISVSSKGSDAIISFKPLEVIIPIALTVTASASNSLQIWKFLSTGKRAVGFTMLALRVSVALFSTTLLVFSFSRKSLSKRMVAKYLHQSTLWVLISVISLTDPSHLRLLPWRYSEFVDRSRGFPTLNFFKLCLLNSALSSLGQLSLSITMGVTTSSIVSFTLSLSSFLLAIVSGAIKLMAERIQSYDLDSKVADLEAEISRLKRGRELSLASVENPITKSHTLVDSPECDFIPEPEPQAGQVGGLIEPGQSSHQRTT